MNIPFGRSPHLLDQLDFNGQNIKNYGNTVWCDIRWSLLLGSRDLPHLPQKKWIQNFKLVGLKYKERKKKNSNRDLYSIKKIINTKNYYFIFYF